METDRAASDLGSNQANQAAETGSLSSCTLCGKSFLSGSPHICTFKATEPGRFNPYEALDCIQVEAEYIHKNAVETGLSGVLVILSKVEHLRAYITGMER